MLPLDLPLFPLPNVVLFPDVCLPLRIFEPRYRQMLAAALNGDRLIGMVLLKAGHQAEYEGEPPVYQVGCAGLVTHAEQLEDGRSNIVLHGIQRFRILTENHELAYRRARVEALLDPLDQEDRRALHDARHRLEALVGPVIEGAGAEVHIPPTIPDHELVNALAQYLPLDAVEKQALLERDGVLDRCDGLIELLEMKVILARTCRAASFRQ
jgi:Lon protease-like protein